MRVGRGGRAIEGFVLRIARGTWDTTLREIESVVDSESYLSSELIELARRIARHYAAPIARTLKAMIPTGVRNQSGMKTVRYARLLVDPSAIESAGRRIGPKQRALLEALALARASVPTEGTRSHSPPAGGVDGADGTSGDTAIYTKCDGIVGNDARCAKRVRAIPYLLLDDLVGAA